MLSGFRTSSILEIDKQTLVSYVVPRNDLGGVIISGGLRMKKAAMGVIFSGGPL